MITQNDTSPIDFFMADSADPTGDTPKTGLTPTVTLSKDGGAFGAAAGTVAEISNGWYRLTPTSGDTGTLGDLAMIASAAGAFTWRDRERVTPAVPLASDYTQARAAKLDNADVATSTRLAAGSYAAPDNASIAAIKTKTDNLPAAPAAVSNIPTAVQNADALLARNQKGGSNGPAGQTVADALASGFLVFSISAGVLTVKNGDGTVAYTRDLTRAQLDAIIAAV